MLLNVHLKKPVNNLLNFSRLVSMPSRQIVAINYFLKKENNYNIDISNKIFLILYVDL